MRIAVYPGSFDPITLGHFDIAQRAAKLFDRLIIAVYEHPAKDVLFSPKERLEMVQAAVESIGNVQVDCFSGLAVDYAKGQKAIALVRGLRAISDFEFELQMAHMNRHLNSEVEATFLMTSSAYAFLSSSMIKEVAKLGGALDALVPNHVAEALNRKFDARYRAAEPPISSLVP